MNERVDILKQDNQTIITIKAFKDETKQKYLLAWIVLFSLCGLAIISQFFFDYDKSSKIFFAVYLAFWFYFEFKVIYAFRWRNIGLEKIVLTNSQLILIKEIGKRGVSQQYEKEKMSELQFFEPSSSGFVQSLITSYWNINKYSLAFKYEGSIVPFGIELDKHQAKKVMTEIKK